MRFIKNILMLILIILTHTDKSDVHSIGNDNADRLANLAIGLTDCPIRIRKKKKRIKRFI